MLEQAQRLQRQFFRFGHVAESQPRWEPPVDLVTNGHEIAITVALPGVAPENVRVRIEHDALNVTAVRALPVNERTTAVHQLEIPYGRFERRLSLGPGHWELVGRNLADGCLKLLLVRR